MGHYDYDEPRYLKANWISQGVREDRNKLWIKVRPRIEEKTSIKKERLKLSALKAQLKVQDRLVSKLENEIHSKISKEVDKLVKKKYGSEEEHEKIHERTWNRE